MYKSLNICQKFTRLVTASEDEEIPAVQEEINYLFASNNSQIIPLHEKYAMLDNKRFCYRNFADNSKAFYSLAMKYHRIAEDSILSDNSTPENINNQKYIIELLIIHRHIIIHRSKGNNSVKNLNFLMYKNSILKFTELPTNAQQKLISGLINKQQESPIKGYFHLMLDVLWIFLTMKESLTNKTFDQTELKTEIIELMQEIHFVMYKCYEKLNKFHVICSCLKVFWLRMQLFCEELNFPFWELFNSSMGCYNEEFSLQMLKFMANLQCFSIEGQFIGVHCHRVEENLEFFNKNWNLLMKNTSDVDETKILKLLINIESLLTDLWLNQGKLEFYYLTWDYYNKKLEHFKENKSFQQLLTEVDTLTSNSDCKQNGYLIFLRMLKKHLKTHPHHWNKFKGRIYTKLPPAKFQKLNENGLQNIALLFFALQDVNFEEITGKFLGLLKDLPEQRQNVVGTWDVYIFMMKQHLEKQTSITQICTIFNPLLESASRNRNYFHLLTHFINNLSGLYRVEDLTLKQSLLIGQWLENYIKSCSLNDLISLLNTLSMIIERIVEGCVWYEYENAFITHVFTPLRKLNINQSIIGTVAGLIVANSSVQGLDDVLEHFVSENIPGDVMLAFFMTLRRKSLFTSSEKREFLTLKAWFLAWIIGIENEAFTAEILQLLKVKFKNFETFNQESNIFERFLNFTDKETLLGCLKDSERFFLKNISLNVYMNMALVFNTCGNVVFTRTTSNCYVVKFVDVFLLPLDVLRGTRPGFLPHVEKTWHLFMFSLWKLNAQDNNPYLERLMKDLIVRYIPHFSSKPTIVVKITNNQELADFVFGHIANEFFEKNKSKFIGDEATFKALNTINTILDDFLFEGVGNKGEMIVLFARKFLVSLYEVYMFKNHKVIVMDMIKKLAVLRSGTHEIRRVFSESLVGIMKKHIAFSTNQYFQMMFVIVKIVGDVVQGLLGRIKEEITLLECKRGQGFDNNLRQSYDKLVKLC